MNKKLFPNLRPIGIDLRLAGSTNPLARAWQLFRGTLVDRGVYWGLLMTLALPALFAAFGDPSGFAFHGGVCTAIWTSVGFWFYTLVSSIALGFIPLKLLGKEKKKAVRYSQQTLFVASVFAFFLGVSAWFPTVLTVSLLGAIVGTVAVTLIAEWAIGTCTGPECEI